MDHTHPNAKAEPPTKFPTQSPINMSTTANPSQFKKRVSDLNPKTDPIIKMPQTATPTVYLLGNFLRNCGQIKRPERLPMNTNSLFPVMAGKKKIGLFFIIIFLVLGLKVG